MAEGLTPFATRLHAVWLLLRTRWLYWLLVALFALACGDFARRVDLQRNEPAKLQSVVSFPRILRPQATLGGPGGLREVAPVEARTLQIFASPASWSQTERVATLPKVDRVYFSISATGDDLRWLAEQPKLMAVSLVTTAGQSAEDVGQLSASPSLRHLRVFESAAYQTDDPIAWPPNLEVADLQGARGLPLRRLEELSRLPRLHTLAVRLNSTPTSPQLSEDVLALLKTFPALRRLYLIDESSAGTALVRETQRSLPGVWVRPATYDDRRIRQWPVMGLVASVWVAIIGIMLSPSFAAPQSVLWPGFRGPHLGLFGGLLLAGLGIVLGLLRYAGCGWLTSAGLCGGALAVSGLVTGLLRRADPGMPGFTQPFIALPVFCFVWPAILGLGWLWPGEFDWYLRGERPGVSLLLIVLGVLLTADTVVWLMTLHRRVEEHGRGGCPLGMNFQAWQVWALAAAQHRKPQEWQWWLTGLDQRLNGLRSGMPLDGRHRRRLWDAGSMLTPTRAAWFMLLLSAITFGGFGAFAYLVDDLPKFDPKLLMGGFVYSAIMTLYLPAIYKYLRRQYYPMELLRPVSRTDWIRDWFTLSAYELLIPLGLVLSGMAIGWGLRIWSLPPGAYWVPISLLIAGVFLTIWAAELWLLTYHWSAIAVVVVLAALGCGMFAFSISSSRFAWEAWLQSVPGVWSLALGSWTLGGLLTYGARRRWMTWELAA